METLPLSSEDGNTLLKLPAVMDIRAAEPLLTSLQEALGRGARLVIDATAVDRLSTPCVQVLIGAAQQMEQSNIAFTIKNPSDAFVSGFDDLGLFSYLMKWPVQT